MSKALNIPWNSVKCIIKKCKEYGTFVNLARAGRPHKLSDLARRRLVRGATYDYSEGVISFSSWDGRDCIQQLLPGFFTNQSFIEESHCWKKPHIKYRLEFTKRQVRDSMVRWKKALWSDETKVELFFNSGSLPWSFDWWRTQATVVVQKANLYWPWLIYKSNKRVQHPRGWILMQGTV